MNTTTVPVQTLIGSVAQTLLEPRDNFFRLTQAIADYRSLLYSVSGMDEHSKDNRQSLFFENGKAIGAFWAAKCLDELLRTKRFVCGLHKAVRDARQKNGERPVRVLYAGTGPFATLMIPLTAMFSADEVQFTLIEINPATFDLLKKTITALGLSDYVASFELSDATTFRISPENKPDIILSETMQHALIREMQVPVIFNLASQAGKDVVIIPERISLDLGWMDPGQATQDMLEGTTDDSVYRTLGNFFELNRTCVDEFAERFSRERSSFVFPKKTFALEPANEREDLVILTRIDVYGGECLGINECSLTIPYNIVRLTRRELRSGTISIGYKISDSPAPEILVIK